MKVSRNAFLTVVAVASAGLSSQAGAFVPAASFANKCSVGPSVDHGRLAAPNRNVLTTVLSMSSDAKEDDMKEAEALEAESKGLLHDGWSKLVEMKDFDPDDDEDDEKAMEVLDAAIDALEVDAEKDSTFASILSFARTLRGQMEKKSSIGFATYGDHPEVCSLLYSFI